MAVINYVTPIICKTFDTSTLTDSWQPVRNELGLDTTILRIVNNSHADVYVSFDGNNLHDFLKSDTSLELNFCGNNFLSHIHHTTKIWVKGSPKPGFIYISGYCLFKEI